LPAPGALRWGMTPGELAAVRGRLEEFAAEMFAPLARSDQRAKGQTYVRGLLLDGRRKSMQPMAERLGVDHQGLQQFVSSSTWAVEPVRERLAGRAVEVIAPAAWVVDDTGFPKGGVASPGVARQYSGTLGKVGNCQIGVSICAVTDAASCPLNWRLFLPAAWDDAAAATPEAAAAIRARRARAGIPDDVRHREKWRQALDMIDELAGWGLTPPLVVSDAGYGDNAEFRDGLSTRGRAYVVQVSGNLSAHAEDAVPELKPYSGRGRRPLPRYRSMPVGLRDHVLAAGRAAVHQLTWREGSRGPMTSHFVALRVRPAGHHQAERRAADGSLPAVWLLAEWPPEEPEPTRYWLSTLPADTPLAELVRLAKIRWRIEHDYRECKTGLGLDHFEGRTFAGWHRHVTLVTAAQLFLTLLRLDPKAAAPA
jgi:SRSO17 transposase